jgi:hypothetical protein
MDPTEQLDIVLKKRYWLIQNFDWFLDEAIFHRNMKDYFSADKFKVWDYGAEEGKVRLYETAERSE